MKTVEILDSTLRDGSQSMGISFSLMDKIHIAQALDELGISYIEAGNPSSNPKDLEFFKKIKEIKLQNSKICAFGSTRRKNISCENDESLQSLLLADTQIVVIFGKSWLFHVTDVIKTTPKENLSMIYETCVFLKKHNKRVFYDAEHFFTAFKENKEYALKTIEVAIQGGAELVTLCETNGGFMIDDLKDAVEKVVQEFGKRVKIGIHCHNDCGLAVANSLVAVSSGASHVQGVLLGFGERSGNANLSTIIANLQLKMNYQCVPKENLSKLTSICHRISEIANLKLNVQLPYVGANAFAHKGGMHVDAVLKNPIAYEHISPSIVGNQRVFLISEFSGKSTIYEKVKKIFPYIERKDSLIKKITSKVKELEAQGFQFEGADGSFELMVKKIAGIYKPSFKLHYYQTNGSNPRPEEGVCCCAQIKVEVDNKFEITAGEGDGPVHALDIALRKALEKFYPQVSTFRLVDYKVRVLDSKTATASKVRVIIETTDGKSTWTTFGVSSDLIEASWIALSDSFEYKLSK